MRGLPQVFNPRKRPWVAPDEATADEIADVVERCPTGALHFHRLDGGGAELPDVENSVLVSSDGPLYLRGAAAPLECRTRADEPVPATATTGEES